MFSSAISRETEKGIFTSYTTQRSRKNLLRPLFQLLQMLDIFTLTVTKDIFIYERKRGQTPREMFSSFGPNYCGKRTVQSYVSIKILVRPLHTKTRIYGGRSEGRSKVRIFFLTNLTTIICIPLCYHTGQLFFFSCPILSFPFLPPTTFVLSLHTDKKNKMTRIRCNSAKLSMQTENCMSLT